MPLIVKTIDVDVSAAKAYQRLVDDMVAMPDWWPPMESMSFVTPPPVVVGTQFAYVYRVTGATVRGTLEITQLDDAEGFVLKGVVGLITLFECTLKPVTGGTRVTVSVDYRPPTGSLAGLLDSMSVDMTNDRELTAGLQALRLHLESVDA